MVVLKKFLKGSVKFQAFAGSLELLRGFSRSFRVAPKSPKRDLEGFQGVSVGIIGFQRISGSFWGLQHSLKEVFWALRGSRGKEVSWRLPNSS